MNKLENKCSLLNQEFENYLLWKEIKCESVFFPNRNVTINGFLLSDLIIHKLLPCSNKDVLVGSKNLMDLEQYSNRELIFF